jgi:hypothetical protein
MAKIEKDCCKARPASNSDNTKTSIDKARREAVKVFKGKVGEKRK